MTGSRMADNLFNSMLLVVDGSEPSIAAAHYAVDLASQSGGRITAIYVVDTATMEYLTQMKIFVSEEREEFEKELEQTGRRYLDFVRTIAEKEGHEVDTIIDNGTFHQVVLQAARDLPADVVVLGGWRRSITRKDVTSVERQLILDQADCPVIVVKSQNK
ncbi:MAG: universal stress protein [Lentisphaeria bacterium]